MLLIDQCSRLKLRIRRELSTGLARRSALIRCARPVISFTFDDFPDSAVKLGGGMLQAHGLTGTFYASIGLMNRDAPTGRIFGENDLRELLAQGHELGCHTFPHCDAWDTDAVAYEKSIVENRTALLQLAPQINFLTHSYPISCPSPAVKKVAARHFPCCRSGGLSFNHGKTDLNALQAVFLEKNCNDFAAIRRVIEENRLAAGWLIFATHDIAEHPTAFGITPDFLLATIRCAIASGALILPVAAALKYAKAASP